MASFSKRYDNWQTRISYKDIDNVYKVKQKGGFKTKKAAMAYATEFEMSIKNGINSISENITFYNYFENWITIYKNPNSSSSTLARYANSLMIIGKYFKKTELSTIKKIDYQLFINEYGKTHSKASVKKINGHIGSCIKNAIDDDIIRKNFTSNVVLTFDSSRTRKVTYLDAKQSKKLLKHLNETLDDYPLYNMMIIVALHTGLRVGEALALTWRDINFNFKTLEVNKSWDYKDKKIKSTKTDSSMRIISIDDDLIRTLKRFKKMNHSIKINDPLFMNGQGKIVSPEGANKALNRELIKCDIIIPGFHFHSLRHTHTSYLLYKGVSIYYISQRLGHSSFKTTIDIYSHVIDELDTKEKDKTIAALSDLSNSTALIEQKNMTK
ncbi:tyrosine-type recombinase/integrase [Dellaglioa algida]|uniref:Integrase n=1 Tax=Dellaglioa algida TaxID=105612 RepID=A0A5C6M8I6_9LACO|nr:tyrosine-type recombinase/integrase [Dellaglioa algida]MDK1720188.1 tyrosine-type recombinase/integrase [Dellaglioa algida]MDK1723578.1 tyrosine-type recombinase/integrase [Dellaglioa algida]TWW10509.1 integrase [Dellaglioa algida]